MDTIKINVDIHTELSKKEKEKLSKWDVVLKINDTLKGHNITLSIPRNFFKNNSYLITKNQEVETVLSDQISFFHYF